MSDLQTSQPHLHAQMVSGKLSWGETQAAKLIAANFLMTAGVILLGASAPILQFNRAELNTFLSIAAVGAIAASRSAAKSILETCRHNLPYRFPSALVVYGSMFGLLLLVLLAIAPREGQAQIADAPVAAVGILQGIALIASWWAILAIFLMGTAFWLWLWARKIKPNLAKTEAKDVAKNEVGTSEHLSVISDSDRTVLISPTALLQQPRQFNSVAILVFSLFFWTMVDLQIGVKAILAIAIAAAGLTGISIWQIYLYPQHRILALHFSGLWGLGANYTIDLRAFSRLALVKMQESSGEISWMQLTGNSLEITLPSAITTNFTRSDADEDELGKVLREKVQLARHDTNRDSLGLIGVLLPQGAGILAGICLLAIGSVSLFLLPMPAQNLLEGAVILLAVCLLSPAIAWYILNLIAPNSLAPDRMPPVNHIQVWEIGAAIAIAAVVLPLVTRAAYALPLLFLACAWLSFGVGACILTLTRRTPIVNQI